MEARRSSLDRSGARRGVAPIRRELVAPDEALYRLRYLDEQSEHLVSFPVRPRRKRRRRLESQAHLSCQPSFSRPTRTASREPPDPTRQNAVVRRPPSILGGSRGVEKKWRTQPQRRRRRARDRFSERQPNPLSDPGRSAYSRGRAPLEPASASRARRVWERRGVSPAEAIGRLVLARLQRPRTVLKRC